MLESLKKVILAGLGAASVSGEKVRSVVDGLVRRGELTREQAEKLIEEISSGLRTETRSVADGLSRQILRLLDRSPVVSRREFHRLERRVRALEGGLREAGPEGTMSSSQEGPPEPREATAFAAPDEVEPAGGDGGTDAEPGDGGPFGGGPFGGGPAGGGPAGCGPGGVGPNGRVR